jgi:NifB/MoaA-like Fe-S oxidoreductase
MTDIQAERHSVGRFTQVHRDLDLAVEHCGVTLADRDALRETKSATMRTMHDIATLLDAKLGTLVVEAEELWGERSG